MFDFLNKYSIKLDNNPQLPSELSIEEFLDLVHEAALSLLRYYHSKGIVHNDLKPENIKIVKDKHFSLYPIDLDLAKSIYEKNENSGGTREYVSPESAHMKNTNFKSDVYGLILSMQFLLGDPMPPANQAQNPNKFKRQYPVLRKLLQSGKISKIHADEIYNLFESALCFDPNQRCNVEFIIQSSAQILWEMNKQKAILILPKEKLNNLELSHQLALDVKYRQFNCSKQIVDQQEIYFPVLVINVTVQHIQNLQKDIFGMVSRLDDDSTIIEEFSRTSCIQAIRDMRSKVEVMVEISSIIHEYLSALYKLHQLNFETTEPSIKAKTKELLSSQNTYSFNLDNLKILANIFSHELEKLNKQNDVQRPDIGLLKKPILFRPATPTSRPGTPIKNPESPRLLHASSPLTQ